MPVNKERHITHLDLDSFFVSVECLRNPKLTGKPVIIGGNSNRGVVASCSYEARAFGIHSAMPMKIARGLCPHAVIVRGDMEAYSKYSGLVTDIIKDSAPLFEKSSIDEFYVDLTGMDRFFNCRQFSDELKKKIIKESGLPISYALAGNKLIGKIATNEVKPNGQIEIPTGNEKAFLAPLAVEKIPGVGKKTAQLLLNMGISSIKTLSETPIHTLENVLGQNGTELWHKANGIDETPVVPFHEQKSISTENTFQQDTFDIGFLNTQLVRMTEKIAFELRSKNKLTGCVAVKLRYSNFETFTKQQAIPYTNADHLILKVVKNLFSRLYNRRMPVRLIGVHFSNLIPGSYQINLFDDSQEMIRLYQAIDGVKTRFGEEYVSRAAGKRKSPGS